jgi:hypothetical protein
MPAQAVREPATRQGGRVNEVRRVWRYSIKSGLQRGSRIGRRRSTSEQREHIFWDGSNRWINLEQFPVDLPDKQRRAGSGRRRRGS